MKIQHLFHKLGPVKIKFFFIFILIIGVYLFVFFLLSIHFEIWRRKTDISSVALPYVVVHIDLKGAPPKLKYLESLLPELRVHGVNGLLMEYEDMFPYSGKIANISARNCYDRSQLQNFLQLAVNLGFEIIPLVQTFGHLEHVLKLKEFSRLRESPGFPDSLCPSKQASKVLVRLMLEQVIKFHERIQPLKHIHVGCDEVYQLNKCPLCKKKQITDSKLFLEHVQFVSMTVRDLSPNTTVLIWDDMIRSNPLHLVNFTTESQRFDNIEPVYWDYTSSLVVSHVALYNYHKVFKNIWAASAFKGAEGPTASIPHLPNRASNHHSWMDLISNLKLTGRSFKGIILTGWSRYSHMDPLCELLPISYPSLILNLMIVKNSKLGVSFNNLYEFIKQDYKEILQCDTVKDLGKSNSWVCYFDGWDLMNLIYRYDLLIKKAIIDLYSQKVPLSSYEYYSKYNKINLKEAFVSLKWCNETLLRFEEYEKVISKSMKLYYNEDVIQEYVGYKCYSIKEKIKVIQDNIYNCVNNVRFWERNSNILSNSSSKTIMNNVLS